MNQQTEIKQDPTQTISAAQTLDEISKVFLSSSGDWSEKGLAIIKKYPLHTAMVAGGIGFLLGTIVTRK
jgi:ElaB/YqjD/DUF883 family membrane-anchored ribosome-binding protein